MSTSSSSNASSLTSEETKRLEESFNNCIEHISVAAPEHLPQLLDIHRAVKRAKKERSKQKDIHDYWTMKVPAPSAGVSVPAVPAEATALKLPVESFHTPSKPASGNLMIDLTVEDTVPPPN